MSETVLLEVILRVRVKPEEMRPYPAIEKLDPLERAIRLTTEKTLSDLRWMDGVEGVERTTCNVIDEVQMETVKPVSEVTLGQVYTALAEAEELPGARLFERRRENRRTTVLLGERRRRVVRRAADREITRCPTCYSPDPLRHPAVQFEGEVQVCRNTWHYRMDVVDPRD